MRLDIKHSVLKKCMQVVRTFVVIFESCIGILQVTLA